VTDSSGQSTDRTAAWLQDHVQGATALDDRLEELRRRLEKHPDDPECLYALGIEHARIGQDDRAIAHLELATNLAPEFADAWIQIAACQHRSHNFRSARSSLERASEAATATDDAQAIAAILALERQLEQE
jgi:Flp pilus assembly protein TadD